MELIRDLKEFIQLLDAKRSSDDAAKTLVALHEFGFQQTGERISERQSRYR